ncbi:dihydrodipicolinate synthase family protein [Paenibacillus sp. MBLB4367]|uniref:dihydrodipicolinate synthase family protein n=1 Tax=Paenibacillus sp. MBLB4367 TaxID=3384767 RepID=UPI003908327A
MRKGYYTALGTPLDGSGNVIEASLRKHAEDQAAAGASGLLAMGSMGIQPQIKDSQFVKVAKITAEAVQRQTPVFVGVMDNSVARVKARIESLSGLPLDGVVATTPYYYALTQDEVLRFFTELAETSEFPLYLYDLPGVTKTKIAASTAQKLMSVRNIAGIKSGDLPTVRTLARVQQQTNPAFELLFSGLDVFDAAYEYGIEKNLDGMFSCTLPLANKLYGSLEAGEKEAASAALDGIILLRDTFVEVGVFPGFSYAMNVLGYEGDFAPDYAPKLNEQQALKVRDCMEKLALL